MPADGTTAATEGNGNFGTSPFFGQLWASRYCPINLYLACWGANHNGRIERNWAPRLIVIAGGADHSALAALMFEIADCEAMLSGVLLHERLKKSFGRVARGKCARRHYTAIRIEDHRKIREARTWGTVDS